jgi:hypothetical protein
MAKAVRSGPHLLSSRAAPGGWLRPEHSVFRVPQYKFYGITHRPRFDWHAPMVTFTLNFAPGLKNSGAPGLAGAPLG